MALLRQLRAPFTRNGVAQFRKTSLLKFSSSMSSNRIEDSPLPFEVNTIPRKPDPMIIKLDPDLEAWYTYRESTHRYFQVNKSNILYIIVFVGLLPYRLFHALKRDLVSCSLNIHLLISIRNDMTNSLGVNLLTKKRLKHLGKLATLLT